MKTSIKEIYTLSFNLWMDVLGNKKHGSAPPGPQGVSSNSNEIYDEDYAYLMGAIESLKQIANEINPNKKEITVKLEVRDPVGVITRTSEFTTPLLEEEPDVPNEQGYHPAKKERLFLHVGDCLYIIDKDGYIRDRIIPHYNKK